MSRILRGPESEVFVGWYQEHIRNVVGPLRELKRNQIPEGITQEAAKRNWFFGRVDDIKAEPKLSDMVLVNNSRLSVQPVTASEWKQVRKMGGLK